MTESHHTWHRHQPAGSFSLFFDELNRRRLVPGLVHQRLMGHTKTELIDTIFQLRELLPPPVRERLDDPFVFVANSHLSGTDPNLPFAYRMSEVDALARFAGLYSTAVLTSDPFPTEWIASLESTAWAPSEDDLSLQVAGKLEALLSLKPLFMSGLANIAYNWLPIDDSGKWTRWEAELNRVLEAAERTLLKLYGGGVQIRVSHIPRSGFTMSTASGVQDIVGFQDSIALFSLRELTPLGRVADLTERSEGLITKEVDREHPWFPAMFKDLVGPILRDLAFQCAISMALGVSHISSRPAGIEGLEASNSSANAAINRRIFEALAHDVPVVREVSIDTLLRLRKREAESFEVYRDAIRFAVREASSESGRSTEIFNDIIRPELAKVDLAVRRNKQSLLRSAWHDALIGTGTVALGIYAGLVAPTAGATVAALGGLKAIAGTAKSLLAAADEPQSARENHFYFLWKLRNETERRNRRRRSVDASRG